MANLIEKGNNTLVASGKKELKEVFFLRGLASLLVCAFHLVLGNSALFPSDNILEQAFSFGYLGVEIFFILSGYVICYSLPENFAISDLGTFFLKRISRIEPPYVVSIVLVISLNLLSQKITHTPFTIIEPLTLLGHLAYINNFIPDTYVNVVYWTLGIEFQFYVLIALVFPFVRRSRILLYGITGFFLAAACISIPSAITVIIPFLAYFCLGITLFFYKIKKRIQLTGFVVILVLSVVQLYLFQGVAGMVAAIITVIILLFWDYVNPTIRFFSTISYSLYLIHVPVGGKVINLGMRYAHSDLGRYLLVVIALVISICFAYLFYKWVELPAFRLSKRFRYHSDSGKQKVLSIQGEMINKDFPIATPNS